MSRFRVARRALPTCSTTLLLLCGAPALAETPPAPAAAAPAALAPGHSMHGEAFNEGPRQAAYLMAGMGRVNFPVTTASAPAQQFFNQGVAQLYGFWYFEAERSFRQVAALDPNCAMAYWGLAMANINNAERAKKFIAEAVKRKEHASGREIQWIDPLGAYYAAEDNSQRRREFIRSLEAILHDHPDDLEAKAFLARYIWEYGAWATEESKRVPIGSHQAVDALLDQVFAVEPRHAAHHFRIHLWDDEKAARALTSAARCGQSAPGIAHMWHMPGHTYSKLQRYADAAWQQEASSRVDHAQMIRDGLLPDQIHNYAHNQEWLIRDLAHLGRAHDGERLARNLWSLPRHPKYNKADGGGSASLGRQRLLEVLEQFEQWPTILQLDARIWQEGGDAFAGRLKQLRLLGRANLALGDLAAGRQHIAALEALLKEKRDARYAAADEAEKRLKAENKSSDEIAKAMADALKNASGPIEQVERTIAELQAFEALAAGNPALAKEKLLALKDKGQLRNDQLALALLASGDAAEAEPLARRTAEGAKNESYPLAVLVDVLWRAGKADDAKSEFGKLRSIAGWADLDVAAFARLRPVADALALSADWRTPPAATDVGERPSLESLGPFCWSPGVAASWTLSDADGRPVSLADYRGKPVVVIFYLGFGCLHCVEQLQKFRPLAEQYQAAGISLLAISTESPASLRSAIDSLAEAERLPFPLLSNEDLSVFRAYRAYDDFEKAPLHATYLIDGDGLARWHDIGFEPFMDGEFLLGEAQRLLGQNAAK